jgi:hypothetical protein
MIREFGALESSSEPINVAPQSRKRQETSSEDPASPKKMKSEEGGGAASTNLASLEPVLTEADAFR